METPNQMIPRTTTGLIPQKEYIGNLRLDLGAAAKSNKPQVNLFILETKGVSFLTKDWN